MRTDYGIKLDRGVQVVYMPPHTNGKLSHPDIQFGFVQILDETTRTCFCRYWMKGKEGEELRTKANAEGTPYHLLIPHNRVPQEIVDRLLEIFEKGGEIK